jgi:hypothetical protein
MRGKSTAVVGYNVRWSGSVVGNNARWAKLLRWWAIMCGGPVLPWWAIMRGGLKYCCGGQ